LKLSFEKLVFLDSVCQKCESSQKSSWPQCCYCKAYFRKIDAKVASCL